MASGQLIPRYVRRLQCRGDKAKRKSPVPLPNRPEECPDVTHEEIGLFECGEMAVREEARGLLLPTAIFARWSR